jgi:hypothetical protein
MKEGEEDVRIKLCSVRVSWRSGSWFQSYWVEHKRISCRKPVSPECNYLQVLNPSTLHDSWQCLQKRRNVRCSVCIITSLLQYVSFESCFFPEVGLFEYRGVGGGLESGFFYYCGAHIFCLFVFAVMTSCGAHVEDQCHLTVSSGIVGLEDATVVTYVTWNEDCGHFRLLILQCNVTFWQVPMISLLRCLYAVKACIGRGCNLLFLTTALERRPGHLTARKRAPCTIWIDVWMGPIPTLVVETKRKILCLVGSELLCSHPSVLWSTAFVHKVPRLV